MYLIQDCTSADPEQVAEEQAVGARHGGEGERGHHPHRRHLQGGPHRGGGGDADALAEEEGPRLTQAQDQAAPHAQAGADAATARPAADAHPVRRAEGQAHRHFGPRAEAAEQRHGPVEAQAEAAAAAA